MRFNSTPIKMAIAGLLLSSWALVSGFFVGSAFGIDSGSLGLVLSAGRAGQVPFAGIAGIAPGDSVVSYVNYTQSGSSIARSAVIYAKDATPSELTLDPKNGLQVAIDGCLEPWGMDGVCGSGARVVLVSTPVARLVQGVDTRLSNFEGSPGAVNYLRFTIRMPDSGGKASTRIMTSEITWSVVESQG